MSSSAVGTSSGDGVRWRGSGLWREQGERERDGEFGEGELVGAAVQFIVEEREGESASGREKKQSASTPLMAINGGFEWREREKGKRLGEEGATVSGSWRRGFGRGGFGLGVVVVGSRGLAARAAWRGAQALRQALG
jgi:hypothetical protein